MNDDATRRAMHVLLDMIASQESGAPDTVNQLAVQTALQGFDPDAIKVVKDNETGAVSVDASALLTAAGMSIHSLLGIVAIEKGQDELTVLSILREHLDRLLTD